VNFLKLLRIVAWSFFGVRKRASHQADMATVKLPLLPVVAVALAGGFGALLFSLARIAASVAH
jgi:nitrate reductase NapE component